MGKPWEEMTPHERHARNVLIAVACGWTDEQGIFVGREPSSETYGRVPAYTTDPTAARQVEDEIERRGLVEEYIDALVALIDPEQDIQVFNSAIEVNTHSKFDGHKAVWALIRATPEQRCRAALRAMGVEV